MIINHNMMAMNTYNKLTSNNAAASKSLEKLSSGLRINRAGDDAAGLAISEKMRGQIRGLDQGGANAQNGISLIQTAEGALTETHSILQRMRELAVQSANDTNTDSDRGEIQKEINALTDEIDRIANTTEFNTKKLLNGDMVGLRDKIDGKVSIQLNTQAVATASVTNTSLVALAGSIVITRVKDATTTGIATAAYYNVAVAGGVGAASTELIDTGTMGTATLSVAGTTTINLTNLDDMKVGESITISLTKYEAAKTDATKSLELQVGANSGQNIMVGVNSMKAADIGMRETNGDALDVSSYYRSTAAIATIDNAISLVSAERSKMGAVQNRLEHTINNLSTASENISASESRIRDVDMAKEMMNYQKTSILQQAATSMLAQANQQPQNVLKLLQ